MFHYKNGILHDNCSATMVGKEFVLTAGHCVYNILDKTFDFDSLLVAPAYDNSVIQPSLPFSLVDKFYIFKRLFDGKSFEDIALLQLRQPIGNQIGWMGIEFSSDTSYYTDKVYHKLSYPGVTSPFDSSRIYNGDTLYYNYGLINNLSSNHLGVISPQALGIPGQSGSSFFYTDNNNYYISGVASYSSNYRHFKITNNIFYQLKNIIENYATTSQEVLSEKNRTLIYPNPFNTFTEIHLSENLIYADLILYNSFGQEVKQVKNVTGQTITLYRDNLSSGIYLVRIIQNNKVIATDKLVIID